MSSVEPACLGQIPHQLVVVSANAAAEDVQWEIDAVSAYASAKDVQWEIDAVSTYAAAEVCPKGNRCRESCCLVVTMIRDGLGVNGQSVEIEYERLLEMKDKGFLGTIYCYIGY